MTDYHFDHPSVLESHNPWRTVAFRLIETDTPFLDLTAEFISNPRWSDAINAGFRYERREDRDALCLFALLLAELEPVTDPPVLRVFSWWARRIGGPAHQRLDP